MRFFRAFLTSAGFGILFLGMAECVPQSNGQTKQEFSPLAHNPFVHVVEDTVPSGDDLSRCVSNILSVSSAWATERLSAKPTEGANLLSAYGRKISFRHDVIGRVADVEFFRVDRYPDWRMPRPWIMGGFPYYFRVTVDISNMSVVKGYAESM